MQGGCEYVSNIYQNGGVQRRIGLWQESEHSEEVNMCRDHRAIKYAKYILFAIASLASIFVCLCLDRPTVVWVYLYSCLW